MCGKGGGRKERRGEERFIKEDNWSKGLNSFLQKSAMCLFYSRPFLQHTSKHIEKPSLRKNFLLLVKTGLQPSGYQMPSALTSLTWPSLQGAEITASFNLFGMCPLVFALRGLLGRTTFPAWKTVKHREVRLHSLVYNSNWRFNSN